MIFGRFIGKPRLYLKKKPGEPNFFFPPLSQKSAESKHGKKKPLQEKAKEKITPKFEQGFILGGPPKGPTGLKKK